ncbi:MAG: transcriptional regulator [Myroides sp.]|nr:transcriptional regulator [Myroides sp.]MDO5636661.1 transcriptional regulator [Myroides sp.]
MIAIITGDVVTSRSLQPEQWLTHLKKGLALFGEAPVDWDIYRGDGFQLRTTATDALLHALMLKAWMKHYKQIDVRLSIGVGKQTYTTTNITQGNGSAFEFSGEGFDRLDKKNLSITTADKLLNDTFSVMIDLSLLVMDKWTEKSAEAIFIKLKHPELNQTQIAKNLGKGQGTVSEALKRGGFDEIYQLIQYYHKTIKVYVATYS